MEENWQRQGGGRRDVSFCLGEAGRRGSVMTTSEGHNVPDVQIRGQTEMVGLDMETDVEVGSAGGQYENQRGDL